MVAHSALISVCCQPPRSDYDEVANINCYHYRLTFLRDEVNINLSEKTGLVEAKFQGKSVGN